VAGRPSSVNPLRLYMRARPRNGFTSSHTTHTIHATGSRAKLSTKKSIKSIAVDQSRVESRERSKVESIDRVDRQLSWIDRVARLDRFRGLSSFLMGMPNCMPWRQPLCHASVRLAYITEVITVLP